MKALVNTVDHLGSVTYKVNDFIDEKVDEVSETELRVSCIEQVDKSFLTTFVFVHKASYFTFVISLVDGGYRG